MSRKRVVKIKNYRKTLDNDKANGISETDKPGGT
jgi:hypothetical protein